LLKYLLTGIIANYQFHLERIEYDAASKPVKDDKLMKAHAFVIVNKGQQPIRVKETGHMTILNVNIFLAQKDNY